MDVLQLADGLWRWTAPHPNAANWPRFGPPVPPQVGCVYYEAPDAVVLIDPPRDFGANIGGVGDDVCHDLYYILILSKINTSCVNFLGGVGDLGNPGRGKVVAQVVAKVVAQADSGARSRW